MVVMVVSLVAGLVVGLLGGSRLEALARIHVVRWWLALAGLGALLLGPTGSDAYVVGTVIAALYGAVFLAANRGCPSCSW